jgi:hypothetical protein
MSLNGWISLHRSLLDNWVSQEPECLAVWIRFLLEANHSDTKKIFNGALVEIPRGSLIFGLEAFSAKSGVTIQKLRRFLKLFEQDGMINRQRTNKYSIISITNYDSFQDTNRQETGKEQADNNQVTSKQQHRNNVNKGNNVNKDNNTNIDFSSFTMCSEAQIQEIIRIRAKNNKANAKKFTERIVKTTAGQFDIAVKAGMTVEEILDEWENRGWNTFTYSWTDHFKNKPKSLNGFHSGDRFDLSNETSGPI